MECLRLFRIRSKPRQNKFAFHSRSLSTLPRPYLFHVGASWAGKPRDPRLAKVRASPFPKDSPIGIWRDSVLAHPKESPDRDIGEDFFYVQEMRNKSGISLGLADGVGGWIDSGIDPSLFSQALMYHAHRYSETSWAGEPETDPTQEYDAREQVEGWELAPVECLQLAHGGVLREKDVVGGSSTACILNLNASSGLLRAANLGDSGFMVIRSSQILYQQSPQTHFFNCPRQLAKLPKATRRRGRSLDDDARDADLYETKLRDGDIVILYTDGLSDNVYPTEIASICALVARQEQSVHPAEAQTLALKQTLTDEDVLAQTMADRIVEYACACMVSLRVSPFEIGAVREGLSFRGGKVDDVTVLVALVRET